MNGAIMSILLCMCLLLVNHYSDVIMGAIGSRITSLTILRHFTSRETLLQVFLLLMYGDVFVFLLTDVTVWVYKVSSNSGYKKNTQEISSFTWIWLFVLWRGFKILRKSSRNSCPWSRIVRPRCFLWQLCACRRVFFHEDMPTLLLRLLEIELCVTCVWYVSSIFGDNWWSRAVRIIWNSSTCKSNNSTE